MVMNCVYCGTPLTKPLKNGISYCLHCDRIIKSSLLNELLSASWDILRYSNGNIEKLKHDNKLTQEQAILVNAFVYENSYSQEDFAKALKQFGIK